jgi:hypothetical protein
MIGLRSLKPFSQSWRNAFYVAAGLVQAVHLLAYLGALQSADGGSTAGLLRVVVSSLHVVAAFAVSHVQRCRRAAHSPPHWELSLPSLLWCAVYFVCG